MNKHREDKYNPKLRIKQLRKLSFLVVIVFAIFLIFNLNVAARQSIIVDAESGVPVSMVSIFDRTGKMIGTGDENGSLPEIYKSAYPITLRSLGYSDKKVFSQEDSIIEMTRMAFDLPEVKVDARKRPILHLTGYLREISTMFSSSDTIMLYREKWVDFMIPAEKEKHYKGWLDPRILKSKSYYKFTNVDGQDSVSDRINHHFSWSDWLSLPPKVYQPKTMVRSQSVSDTIMGVFSAAEIWRRDSTKYRVDVDVLADTLRGKWSPRLKSRLWKDLDFERLLLTIEYSDCDTLSVKPQNIDRMSCYIESMGRGHDMFRFNNLYDNYLYVTTYVDLVIADREYLTVKDARKKEKDRLLALEEASLVLASEKLPRDSVINDLIARVNAIDHDQRRLGMELDKRVGSGRIPAPPVYKTKDKITRALKSVLSGFGL